MLCGEGYTLARCLSLRMWFKAVLVSLSNHLHALGDLGFLVHVWNEASEMASMKTLIAKVRVSVSLIASLSTYFGRLLALHLEYMISTKASSHDSLLLSWKRKDDSVDGGRGENEDFQVMG